MSEQEPSLLSTRHPSATQIETFVGGQGSDAFRDAVQKHLSGCTECRQLAEQAAQTSPSPIANVVAANEPALAEVPSQLANHPQYKIVRELGRGGMGIVYLVQHRLTGREEAIKVLMPELVQRSDVRSRFLREIQAAAKLDHPHICRTLNALEEGELLGLVMSLVPGNDVASLVRQQGPFPVQAAAELAVQACEGLQHASQLGMVHRDIKPGNLMVQQCEGKLHLTILDFGLAKGASELNQNDGQLTRDGRLLGTPEFMSPEQALRPSQADIRSDLYSLGCTLYFMLCGVPPFQGETMLSVVNAQLSQTATPLNEVNPQVPPALAQLVQRLLAKTAAERPQTPAEVIAALLPFTTASPAVIPSGQAQSTLLPASMRPKLTTASKPATAKRSRGRRTPAAATSTRGRRRSSPGVMSILKMILPTLLTSAALIYYHQPLMDWFGLRAQRNGLIVLESMPDDFEVWINDRRMTFTRPTVNSPAQIVAEPGSYQLALKLNGRVLKEQPIAVEAGRELRLVVDESLRKLPSNSSANSRPPQSTSPQTTPPRSTSPQNARAANNPSVNENTAGPTGENVSPVSDDQIATVLAQVHTSLHLRDSAEALGALQQLYVDEADHRVAVNHPRFQEIAATYRVCRSLETFQHALDSALSNRQAAETFFVGTTQVSVVEATPVSLSLRFNGTNQSFLRSELPSNLEQVLVDFALDAEAPSTPLVKAAGLLTHPQLSKSALNLVRQWMDVAIESRQVPSAVQTLVNSFEVQVPEAGVMAADNAAFTHSEPVEDINADLVPTHEFARRLEGATGPVGAIILLPPNVPINNQASLIASGVQFSGRGSTLVNLWNVRTGVRAPVTNLAGPVWAATASANGKVLVTYGYSSQRSNLAAFAMSQPKPFFVRGEPTDPRACISISADGRQLVACGPDETFVRWNLQQLSETSRMVSQKPAGTDNIAALAVRPSLDMVAAATQDGGLRAWHTTDGHELPVFAPPVDSSPPIAPVVLMRFNRNGTRLTAVRRSGELESYDMTKFEKLSAVRGHHLAIQVVSAAVGDRYLATADASRNVRVWDTNNLELVAAFRDEATSELTSVAVDPTADFVAAGYQDSTINLWKRK